jgi:perosamine synthetase
MIPLSVPEMRGNALAYLRECIETNWVSYVGPFVTRFEEQMAKYVGTGHAVATNSGTAALHVALLVVGVKPGDEVLVPDLTFIAPANAIRYAGAFPVFMDVTADHWQMDPAKVAEFLETECHVADGRLRNRKTGRPVTAIMPVHLLGHPVDLQPILDAARRHGLKVIEDATEALGGKYRGRMVGSLGDIACFSFNGNKIITTGGGGMLNTDNGEWARRAKYLTTQAKDDPIEYVHHEIGYNYRLTNLQAAVGVAQMENLDEYVRIKREIAERYAKGLADVPGLTLPQEAPWAFSTFWLYTVLVDKEKAGVGSRELQKALAERNIQTRPLWAPIHEQRPYHDCQAYRIETAPHIYRQALSLPCSVGLREADQQRVIDAVRDLAGGRN